MFKKVLIGVMYRARNCTKRSKRLSSLTSFKNRYIYIHIFVLTKKALNTKIYKLQFSSFVTLKWSSFILLKTWNYEGITCLQTKNVLVSHPDVNRNHSIVKFQ